MPPFTPEELDAAEAIVRAECEAQGVPFELAPEVAARVARLVAAAPAGSDAPVPSERVVARGQDANEKAAS